MSNEELVTIKGGATISAAIISAAVRAFNVTLEIGRTIGTVIRRKVSQTYCTISK